MEAKLYLKKSGSSFSYCGWKIEILQKEIRITMEAACLECSPIGNILVTPERKKQRELSLNASEKSQYRKVLGCAQWCTQQMRIYSSCEINRMAQKIERAVVGDLLDLGKAGTKIAETASRALILR